jgi:hypothetical protein
VLGLYFDSNVGSADWVDFNDPAANRLIERGLKSPSASVRAALARQANARIVRQAPWGFYLHVGNHLPRWQNVGGYVWQTNNFLRFVTFRKG